jgi:hypothetical protein
VKALIFPKDGGVQLMHGSNFMVTMNLMSKMERGEEISVRIVDSIEEFGIIGTITEDMPQTLADFDAAYPQAEKWSV